MHMGSQFLMHNHTIIINSYMMTNNMVSFWDKTWTWGESRRDLNAKYTVSQILAQIKFINGAKSIITITDIYYQGKI